MPRRIVSRPSKETEIEVSVDSLAAGGDAVARHDGRVVFVRGGCAGDVVRARIDEKKRSFWRGEVVEVLRAGPSRRAPRCKLAAVCGGCQWQHVAYPAQLLAKRSFVESAFGRLLTASPHCKDDATPDVQCYPSPAELGYRRRARLTFRKQTGRVLLGFFKARSKQVVDVDYCPLLVGSLDALLGPIRDYLQAADTQRGSVSLLAGGDRTHLSIRSEEGGLPAARTLLEHGVSGVVLDADGSERVEGASCIPLDERGLWASAASFAQANGAVDSELREIVARLVDASRSWSFTRGWATSPRASRELAVFWMSLKVRRVAIGYWRKIARFSPRRRRCDCTERMRLLF
jgi:tRNA/tmRNA/rRNA uracil-C5-methylase (TrmA/RlmC/RlmD family)